MRAVLRSLPYLLPEPLESFFETPSSQCKNSFPKLLLLVFILLNLTPFVKKMKIMENITQNMQDMYKQVWLESL